MNTDHDAQMDTIAAAPEIVGLLTVTTDAEGKAVGRQLAMTQGEDEQPRVLDRLRGEE